jgi:nitroreductase
METWDAIRSRRDVREFADRPIAPGDLDRILEAAWRAPSAQNRQRWEFVAVTGRRRLRELAQVWQGAEHVASSAATVAVLGHVPADAGQLASAWFDLGQAVMQLSLAAADLGIGAGHSAVRDQELARRLLGFPDDRFCAHLVPLGHPLRPLAPRERPKRRPFDEVVRRDRF